MSELWTDAEKRHRRTISTFMPNEGEFKMACRADIADMRDRAAMGKRRCSDVSYGILCEVSRIATDAVFTPMDAAKLYLMRAALQQALDVATALERATNYKPRKPK